MTFFPNVARSGSETGDGKVYHMEFERGKKLPALKTIRIVCEDRDESDLQARPRDLQGCCAAPWCFKYDCWWLVGRVGLSERRLWLIVIEDKQTGKRGLHAGAGRISLQPQRGERQFCILTLISPRQPADRRAAMHHLDGYNETILSFANRIRPDQAVRAPADSRPDATGTINRHAEPAPAGSRTPARAAMMFPRG